jgi:alkylhydroperoxidase family enzyme
VDTHAQALARLTAAILETPGDTDTALRRAVEAHAGALGGRDAAPQGAIPADLVAYVEKVARHAYKVTDGDIERLREAGYSEDAIFELTLATALGAARSRLERGLAALEASG